MEHLPDNSTPILIVDDDTGLLASLRTTLVSSGLAEPALLGVLFLHFSYRRRRQNPR